MRSNRNVRPRLALAAAAVLLTATVPAFAAGPWSTPAQFRQDDPRYGRDDPRAPQGDPRYSRPDDRGYNRPDERGYGRPDERGYGRPDDRGYGRQDDRGYGREDRGNGRDDGYRREGDRGRGGNLPGGSYQASCQGSRMEGSTLVANCRGRSGNRYETALDTSRCGRSDIGNDNGTLQCAGGRGSARRVE